MSRYNNSGGSESGTDNFDNDTTVKLQKYAAVSATLDRTSAFNGNWNDTLIVGYDDFDVLDGVVMRREDDPETYKVFSVGKWFNLNPDDGKVYQSYDPENDQYSDEMTAEEVLEHPRVLGFQETFGGDDFFYKPVGVVIEATGDVALNDDLINPSEGHGLSSDEAARARDEAVIPVGDASMLLRNKSWVRTYAKKITESGDEIIEDNGALPGDDRENPKYQDFGWLTTMEPSLRSDLDGRRIELWITEEPNQNDDGTHTTPNVKDVKTGGQITINNDLSATDDTSSNDDTADQSSKQDTTSGSSADAEAATDGGQQTADTEQDADSDDEESATDDDPATDVPDVLDDVIDYFVKTGKEADEDEIRAFAENEVDDPEAVDWTAAADLVASRQ